MSGVGAKNSDVEEDSSEQYIQDGDYNNSIGVHASFPGFDPKESQYIENDDVSDNNEDPEEESYDSYWNEDDDIRPKDGNEKFNSVETTENDIPDAGDHKDDEDGDEQVMNSSSDEDEFIHVVHELSNGQKIWIPHVPEDKKPKIGQTFERVDLAKEFYHNYADVAGFEVRLSNRKKNIRGVITNRYLLCNKQGVPKDKTFDTLEIEPGKRKRRNTNFKRCGCKAIFRVKFVPKMNHYVVYNFVEHHNHRLLTQEEMMYTKSQRHLTYLEEKNVFMSVTSKMGPSNVHRMRKAMKRGILGPGGSARDHHNYRRDIDTFVGNRDAQMLINKMNNRKKICPEYFFEYKCNDKELDVIFWADETARINYKEFGDVVSFDATFRTNQHAMVFVPFVSIDNHYRTVVIGAALWRREDKVDYEWVLNAFMRVHGVQPKFVITDQCAAMKQAIPKVFTESKHRFCLWHIMEKVQGKVGVQIAKNTSFISELNNLVWDVNLDPDEFKSGWKMLMDKFGLAGDKWFTYMYGIREHWIPAYYKEFPMSGLMKTTSRSESINAFFGVYHAYKHDLVFFLKAFDDAIQEQINKHCTSEMKTKSTTPRIVSPSKIEIHASKIYTRTIFFEVQKELSSAVWGCVWDDVHDEVYKKVFTISETNTESHKQLVYMVVHDKLNGNVDCSCNFFVRNGYLCRHAFKVLLNARIECIPEQYIARRWTREIVPVQWLPAIVRYGEVDQEREKLIAKAQLIMENIIGHVKHEKEALSKFVDQLDEINSAVILDHSVRSKKVHRHENIQEFLAVSEPETVDILPPTGVRNKGCGTGKRLKSSREKAMNEAKKLKRRCKCCHKIARHDYRNCQEKS